MRKLMMFNRVSADGFFSAEDGGIDWATPDPDFEKGVAAGLDGADTILFGRRTYDMFESFWPHAIDDGPTTRDPHAPRRSPELRAMGIWINESQKYVFSKTRKEVTWKNSHLLRAFDPAEIEAMKRGPGKGILVFGSGSLVSQLSEHRLIDEYQFLVSPLLLGKGKSLFQMPKPRKLALLETKGTPSGNVLLRYAPG